MTPTKLLHRKSLDYAWWRPPSMEWLHQNGFTDVERYVAPVGPSTSGKILFADELNELIDAGMRVGNVWETSTNRVLSGHPGGVEDASRQIDHLLHIGYGGDTLKWSYDEDGTANQCRDYAIGYHETVMSSKTHFTRVGAYGPRCAIVPLFHEGLLQFPWQTCSNGFCGGANGTVDDVTVLKQHCVNDNYDTNDVYAEDCGTWNPHLGGMVMDAEVKAAFDAVNAKVDKLIDAIGLRASGVQGTVLGALYEKQADNKFYSRDEIGLSILRQQQPQQPKPGGNA